MGTPVLLIDVAADQYRFAGLKEFTHHCSESEFLSGSIVYDVDSPPPNKGHHVPYRNSLIRRVNEFVETVSYSPWSVDQPHPTQKDRNSTIREIYRRLGRPAPVWRAEHGTFLKRSTRSSSELSSEDKIYVERNAVTGGDVLKYENGHLFLDSPHINGSPVPPGAWCIYKEHWSSIE